MNRPGLLIIGKGGRKEGMGHLVRISALVETFSPYYQVSVLVQQDQTGALFFERAGIEYSTYLDNRGLYRFLEKNTGQEKYTAIIVDIYRIASGVLKKIEQYCHFLVNFDDMQRRLHHPLKGIYICPQEPYNREMLKQETYSIAKGTDFFPLRQVFISCRERKTFRQEVKDIGIILGGAPSRDYNLGLSQLLDSFLAKNINLHVVSGFGPEGGERGMLSTRVHFIKNTDMAEFITKIDMGIIAGGFVKFEMMCIGTPFALVSLCDHQEKLARKFSRQGYGIYLGDLKNSLAHPGRFKRQMEDFLGNDALRKAMFEKSRQLVDGRGSSRILEVVRNGVPQRPSYKF